MTSCYLAAAVLVGGVAPPPAPTAIHPPGVAARKAPPNFNFHFLVPDGWQAKASEWAGQLEEELRRSEAAGWGAVALHTPAGHVSAALGLPALWLLAKPDRAPARAAALLRELARLEGDWSVESVAGDGPRPMAGWDDSEVRLRGGLSGCALCVTSLFHYLRPHACPGTTWEWSFVDPDGQPGAVDLVGNGVVWRGVYRRDGVRLLLRLSGPGAAGRPAGFVTAPGDGTVLFTFR